MADEAKSPLRRRLIEDMTIRRLPKTQRDYVQRVENFAAFLWRSPDTASFEDVHRYQLHLAASAVGVRSRQASEALHRSAKTSRRSIKSPRSHPAPANVTGITARELCTLQCT